MDLVLQDPAGGVNNFLEQWIPPEDIRAVSDWSYGVRNPLPAGIGQPNWSTKLTPRLNTWISPTGASRWAYGYFLVDGATKAAIVNSGAGNGAVLSLISTAGTRNLGRSMAAYLLPPHPVGYNNADPKSMWILPLVDDRYRWQFISSGLDGGTGGIQTQSPFQTWGGLINVLAQALGPSVFGATVPTVPAAYLNPSQWDFMRMANQSAAVILDIALASVGLRLVPDDQTLFGGNHPGGKSYAIHNYQTASAVRDAGFTPSEFLGALQGGVLTQTVSDLQAINPGSITTLFRYYKNGIINDDALNGRQPYTVTPSAAGFPGLPVGPNVKVIRSRALWNFTKDGTENSANLIALATQIASDYYGWASWFQDQAYIGISRQQQTGFDDYREYTMGRQLSDGMQLGRTRVHSLPHNFYQDDMLHWENSVTAWSFGGNNFTGMTWEWGNVITGTLGGNLPANGSQVIRVTDADVLQPTPGGNVTNNVLVTDTTGTARTSGTSVLAVKDGTKWAVVSGGSGQAMLLGQCSTLTDCTAGVTVTINLYAGTQGSETATGTSISVYVRKGIIFASQMYQIGQTAGGFEVLNPSLTFRGQPGSTVAPDATTGSMVIYTGTGSGTASAVTVSNIRNDDNCQVVTGKLAYAQWLDSLNNWFFVEGHGT